MNRLDYVVSGTSYMRLSNPKIATNDTNVEIVNMLIQKLVQDKHNHNFSKHYKWSINFNMDRNR